LRPPRLPAPRGGACLARILAYVPRQVCRLLLRPHGALTVEEDANLTRLYLVCPQVALAEALVEEIPGVLRTRDVDGFYTWLHDVTLSGIPELREVARSMWLDRSAVEAAVATDWSNECVAYCTSSRRSRRQASSACRAISHVGDQNRQVPQSL
jgi:hypothetical protein